MFLTLTETIFWDSKTTIQKNENLFLLLFVKTCTCMFVLHSVTTTTYPMLRVFLRQPVNTITFFLFSGWNVFLISSRLTTAVKISTHIPLFPKNLRQHIAQLALEFSYWFTVHVFVYYFVPEPKTLIYFKNIPVAGRVYYSHTLGYSGSFALFSNWFVFYQFLRMSRCYCIC